MSMHVEYMTPNGVHCYYYISSIFYYKWFPIIYRTETSKFVIRLINQQLFYQNWHDKIIISCNPFLADSAFLNTIYYGWN